MRKLIDGATLALGRALTMSREDLKSESGQGAVEYALVVLGVALVIAAAVAGFTGYITSFMTLVGQQLANYA
jgi:Flp pilus assembly pilin Flp